MDYKSLLARVQKTIASLETTTDTLWTISKIAETIIVNFRDALGITGGRLYERREDGWELVARFGEMHEAELGIQVPGDYQPIHETLENGVVVMAPDDPRVDVELERKLGAHRFAAIEVGDEVYILSFNVARDLRDEDILSSLSLVRYVINQKLREEHFESIMAEAQKIQQSILPSRMPNIPGFDIYGRTVPAEVISGDFYDFIPVSENILGLVIADASGHGLPAALVVRDIYMGLRMATDRDFKIIRTLQKLNTILHRSRLTTKFVSLFYGELETGGIFIYSNAGHNPPFVLKGNRVDLLKHGGPILGPTPNATYTRGFTQLEPGDLMCLYTDGIVEAHDPKDREFGLERLQKIVKLNRARSAQEIVNEVFQRVSKWARTEEDDRTIVVVKALAV